MEKKEYTGINIRTEKKLKKELESLANKSHIKLSTYCRIVLYEHLAVLYEHLAKIK